MRAVPLTSHVVCLVAKSIPHAHIVPPAVRLWRLSTPGLHSPLHASATLGHVPPADFLATTTNHEALGITSPVATALRTAGFATPSNVQALAWPPLLEGQDIVLAAETGSGKTIAYLAPLLVHLLDVAHTNAAEHASRPAALVLCPNAALCQQVQAVAQSMLEALPSEEHGLLRAAWVGSSTLPSPSQRVDVAIATPAALLNILYETGSGCGCVVVQDMLLRALCSTFCSRCVLMI